MIKNTYKSLFNKIKPSDDLILLTKQKMKMKKKQNQKHFSFYHYGAIAACLILSIVITIPHIKNTSNQITSSEETIKDNIGGITNNSFISEVFDDTNSFDNAKSSNETAKKSNDSNLLNKIIAFIKNILNLIYD